MEEEEEKKKKKNQRDKKLEKGKQRGERREARRSWLGSFVRSPPLFLVSRYHGLHKGSRMILI